MQNSIFNKFKRFVLCSYSLGPTAAEKWRIFWRLTKNLRVRFGFAQYHPDLIYGLHTRSGELFLRDNFGDVTNLPNLFYENTYRVEILDSEGVILDIGANIGFFAAWIYYRNPNRQIYCFEPLAENAKLIPLNCPAAQVNNFGLGSKSATLQLDVDDHQIMASAIPTTWPTRKREIQIKPLDEFAATENIQRVAFMKIDTEGMELDVLDGGSKTLEKTENIAIETHSSGLHAGSLERLQKFGFTILDENFAGQTGMLFASRHPLNGTRLAHDCN